ncbi:UPF0150 protein ssr1765 [Geminocystis sp. NIES-3708]|uniref:type II toxin-antitoxin system HicB family antitoxin n=1 Tax=Geminocystis sp. NIES-3708 TaxID=1615909 RepID=UPI0005FCA67F|nr:UPF0150 protein ssr1765 [Geminocystis sp. NIES-3708]
MNNNGKKVYDYTVIVEKEEGSYHAFCPLLKGCHSQGDTFEEAIANITEVIELYIESLIADNCHTASKYTSVLHKKNGEDKTGERVYKWTGRKILNIVQL